MTIALDFDGTVCKHPTEDQDWGEVGEPIPYALETLRELSNHHKIILYTLRDAEGLYNAEMYLRRHGVDLHAIQINPIQRDFTFSPKCFADLYIDDRGLGIPLIEEKDKYPYVDWLKVRRLLKEKEII